MSPVIGEGAGAAGAPRPPPHPAGLHRALVPGLPLAAGQPEIAKWAGDYPEVVFCTIDVDKHSDIADDFHIEDLPTVIFFKNDKVKEMVRGASLKLIHETIVKFRDKPGIPRPLRPIMSIGEFRFITETEKGPVVILVQNGSSGMEKYMETVAGQLPHILICCVDATEHLNILRKLDVKKFPSVVVFLDGLLVKHISGPNKNAVMKMFNLVQKPDLHESELIILKERTDYLEILERANNEHRFVVVFFFADYCGHCKKVDRNILKLAENNQDVFFCKMDVEEHKKLIGNLGIKKVPTFQLYRSKLLIGEVVGSNERELKRLLQRHKARISLNTKNDFYF